MSLLRFLPFPFLMPCVTSAWVWKPCFGLLSEQVSCRTDIFVVAYFSASGEEGGEEWTWSGGSSFQYLTTILTSNASILCPLLSLTHMHTCTTCTGKYKYTCTHTTQTESRTHAPEPDNHHATTDLQSVEVTQEWQLSQSPHYPHAAGN